MSASPDVKTKLNNVGLDVATSSSAEFAKFIRAEHEKWAKVIRDAGIKAEAER
jgi:tripartite-type tricarboxylate transporter receptor subunit TctC